MYFRNPAGVFALVISIDELPDVGYHEFLTIPFMSYLEECPGFMVVGTLLGGTLGVL